MCGRPSDGTLEGKRFMCGRPSDGTLEGER